MKKTTIVLLVFVTILVVGIFVYFLQSSNESDLEVVKSENTSTTTKTSVRLINYSTYAQQLEKDKVDTFLRSVEAYLSEDKLTKQYSASIRENSLKENNNQPIYSVEFIVDIPEIKRSYKSSISSDSSTGQNTIYTLCLDKSEMIYPDFNCKDDLLDA